MKSIELKHISTGDFHPVEEKYLGEAFTEASNREELKTIFKNQWDKVLADDSRTNRLEHILYRMNYLINSSEVKNNKSVNNQAYQLVLPYRGHPFNAGLNLRWF